VLVGWWLTDPLLMVSAIGEKSGDLIGGELDENSVKWRLQTVWFG
jgi:hypothetical protein